MSELRTVSLNIDSPARLWVAQHPETAEVFDILHIDYCCDGDKPLENACSDHGLEVLRVHSLLRQTIAEACIAPKNDWTQSSLTELCDHIVQTHHALLKDSLPLLSEMMADVVSQHGQIHKELNEVQKQFITWRDETLLVMAEEERSLFPAIRQLQSGTDLDKSLADSLAERIRRVSFGHADIGEALKNARSASKNFSAPKDACTKFSQMYGFLRWIEADVRRHVHKEESILFPRVKQLLSR